jgi:hypothetical protein
MNQETQHPTLIIKLRPAKGQIELLHVVKRCNLLFYQ